MTDVLQIRVKGKGNVVGTVSFSRDTDPLEVATIFGKEHSLQAAAVLRLAKRIKTQADLVWKLRDERDNNEQQRVQWSAESEDSEFDNNNNEDEPFLKMRIRRRDGMFGTINFRLNDNPSAVAARFGAEHNLPPDSVARLAVKIKAQCGQGASVPGATSITSMNNDVEGASETKRGESPNTYNRRNNRQLQEVGGGGVGVRRSIGDDFDDFEDERRAEEMYRLARLRSSENADTLDDAMDSEWHLTAEHSPRRLSARGLQSQFIVSSPGGIYQGSSSSSMRGLEFLGREEDEANEHSDRGSSIADVQAERERAWAQARIAAKRLESSSSSSQPASDADGGGLGPRRSASSRSLSPWLERQQQQQATAVTGDASSRSRQQQQLVSERLHAQAKRIADRKAALKVKVEKDRVDEIERSRSLSPLPTSGGSSSSSSGHKHGTRSASAGSRQSSSKGRSVPDGQSFHEALYYNDIKWRQSRGKAMEAQAAERARQLAAEEAKTMTFKPKLSTSKEKQRSVAGRRQFTSTSPRGRGAQKQNRVDVFSYLHLTKVQSQARLREKALQIRREEDAENVFRPSINPLSERLSRRLRLERGGHMTELPSNASRRRLRDSRSPVRDTTAAAGRSRSRPLPMGGSENREVAAAAAVDGDDGGGGSGSSSSGIQSRPQSSPDDGTTAVQPEGLGSSSIPSDATAGGGGDDDVLSSNNNNNNNSSSSIGKAGAASAGQTMRRSSSGGDSRGRGRGHGGVVGAGYRRCIRPLSHTTVIHTSHKT